MTEFAEAEARIRQLHAHCTDAVWRKDAIAFADCFAADAEWRITGAVLRGRDEIGAAFAAVVANAQRVLITFRNPLVEVGQGTAIGRVYVTEQCAWRDRPAFTTIGRYHERYVDEGDRWRFAWRLFELLYKGPADLSGEYLDHADFGAFPAMPRHDAVPPPLRS